MRCWHIIAITYLICSQQNAVRFVYSAEVIAQGLYQKLDNVVILTLENFDSEVYDKEYAQLVQFYNSYCGDCREFQPEYSRLAGDIMPWRNIIRLAVLDCSEEDNNDKCREFQVEEYPSLRYLHENFVKSRQNHGEQIEKPKTAEILKRNIIYKMQAEQLKGYLGFAPSLFIYSFSSYPAAIRELPYDTWYAFLVFENEMSTVGPELALDMNDYKHVTVLRVFDTSELAQTAGLTMTPAVSVINSRISRGAQIIQVRNPTKDTLLRGINLYLISENYQIPIRRNLTHTLTNNTIVPAQIISDDVIYNADLEKTLRTSLRLEVVRRNILKDEPLKALLDYLVVLVNTYPYRPNGNLKIYLEHLNYALRYKKEWSGDEIYNLVKNLESRYAPVYTNNIDYVACKGSQPKYRGFPCGLWTLFHALTVNAANQPGNEAPKVLRAMHGYIKHFFGCSKCSRHFQQMSARNRLFDVKDNVNATLWLWSSHNEVNQRLAGDITEDPAYPKMQFPVTSRCPHCLNAGGVWNIPAVLQHLQLMYGSQKIRENQKIVRPSDAIVTRDAGLVDPCIGAITQWLQLFYEEIKTAILLLK